MDLYATATKFVGVLKLQEFSRHSGSNAAAKMMTARYSPMAARNALLILTWIWTHRVIKESWGVSDVEVF